MFNRKKPEVPKLTISEFIALDMRLKDVIRTWAEREIDDGVKDNTKLAEIMVVNLKLIYAEDEHEAHGKELREFLFTEKNIMGTTDHLFSRVKDLYIEITMSFPEQFVNDMHNRHIAVLEELGYEVDDDIVSDFKFGWLFARIQRILRYESSAKIPIKKK